MRLLHEIQALKQLFLHIFTQPLPARFFPSHPHPHLLLHLGNLYKGNLSVCFNQGDEVVTLNMIKSAPVGPVAGGMGCIMVLVLAVYAYRHQIHRRSHQHMSPLAAQGELEMNPKAPPGSSSLPRVVPRLEGQ